MITEERRQVLIQEARRELARRHMSDFVLYVDRNYQMNWHHQLLCEYLDRLAQKEIRRLMDTPPFPAQPERPVGPYVSVQSALNSRSARRQACPLCGETAWVRRWYSPEANRYYADLRCKTHGSFLSHLTLLPLEDGQWQGHLSIPEMTPPLLKDFDLAIHAGAIPCKINQHHKKHRHFTNQRNFAKKSTKIS